jgi:hypothetical protein
VSDDHTYSIGSARSAAARDELGEWVSGFLASPGSDNAALGEQLKDQRLFWIGPLRVPLDQLFRLAGPADAPVLCPVDEDAWRDDVDELAEKVDDGLEPPPVIVTAQDDQLVVEDGNHRIEALRRAGVDHAWAVIGFEGPEQRDRFVARSEQLPSDER